MQRELSAPLGVVLAGGRNRRFGAPKALEVVDGVRIVERAAAALEGTADRVVLIANDPDVYRDVGLEMRPDRIDAGALAGVHAALAWANELGLPGALVIACDMPFVPASLMSELWDTATAPDADGAVPSSAGPRGVEPLCAAYRTSCLRAIERSVADGDLRIIGFFERVRIAALPAEQVAAHGDPSRMFMNVNTREELELARNAESAG